MRRWWRWYRGRTLRAQIVLAAIAVVVALFAIGSAAPVPEETGVGAASTPAAVTPATEPRAVEPTTKSAPHPPHIPTASSAGQPAKAGTATKVLSTLTVKGRAPKTGYSREQFGDGWTSYADCDTRDRILHRDLTLKHYEAGSRCIVTSGRLADPYTAGSITFVRGGASEVDIDHVVALSDAWQKGAEQWTAAKRRAFANDPLNLLAVSASANRQKGEGDAATWLPANKRIRCAYVARQVAVKRKYKVWMTMAERNAITRILSTCPGQRLPRSGALRIPVTATHRLATPAARPSSSLMSKPSTGEGRDFANCDAVRAAGLAPLHRGTANYNANPRLDRDGDGLACES